MSQSAWPEGVAPKLLVVDDDPIFLAMLTQFLKKIGCDVLEAADGPAALEIAVREQPELILIDGAMPEMDGFETCRNLKKDAATRKIPVIMVTGLSDAESVDNAFNAGAMDFVTKPIHWPVLNQRIRVLIRAARAEREAKTALAALEASEIRFRNMVELSPDAILVHRNLKILYANPAALSLTRAPQAGDLIGRSALSLVEPAYRKALTDQVRSMLQRGEPRSPPMELRAHLLDGGALDVEVVVSITDFHGKLAIQSVIRDISLRKEAEEELKLAATVFETTNEAISVTDPSGKMLKVNPAFSRITGYSAEEALGQQTSLLSSGRHDVSFYSVMWASLLKTGTWEGEIWNRRKNGEIYPQWLSISTVRDDEGEASRRVAVFSDITQRKKAEEKVQYQAHYDALTGLPNRTLFMDRLSQAIAWRRRKRRAGGHVALIFIDLDRFKWVNDNLGHAAGDLLLQEASERLHACVRESDTVARLGGDEFTAVLQGVSRQVDVEGIAEKMLDALNRPFDLAGQEAQISGSVGITLFPKDAKDVEALLKNADSAMYQAKRDGKNAYRFFVPEMVEQSDRRFRLEKDLKNAVRKGELELHYQPIVRLSDQQVQGMEALVRWRHPGFGLLGPGDFLPLAEESGFIKEVTAWILENACSQLLAWQKEEDSGLFLSLNVSPRNIGDPDFPRMAADALSASGLAPASLNLELTEASVLEQEKKRLKALLDLQEVGVRLILDDFGSGFSSLNHLKRLPLHGLKIDGAFVRAAAAEEGADPFVGAILSLAERIGIIAMAEGVETEEQTLFLKALGCDMAQGFHFGMPQPAGSVLFPKKKK